MFGEGLASRYLTIGASDSLMMTVQYRVHMRSSISSEPLGDVERSTPGFTIGGLVLMAHASEDYDWINKDVVLRHK